jgi:hypothetical protein
MEWHINVQKTRQYAFESLYAEANALCEKLLPELSAKAQNAKSIAEATVLADEGDKFLYQLRSGCATALGLVGAVVLPGETAYVNIQGRPGAIMVEVASVEKAGLGPVDEKSTEPESQPEPLTTEGQNLKW